MKKMRPLILVLLPLLLVLAIAGCKTTPKETPETAPDTTVATVVPADTTPDAALVALRDKMEALRNECVKYGIDKHNPTEWGVAEATRQAGLDAYGKDSAVATEKITLAISQYEALKLSSMQALSTELENEVAAMRQAAIDVNAQAYYPEQFALADATGTTARTKRADGDYEAAYNSANLAILQYRTLIKGREAAELKNKIDRNDFAALMPDAYRDAGVKYTESLTIYGTMHAESLSAMEESVALFYQVKNEGYRLKTEDMVLRADEVRALCDSIRAQRTMKAAYDEAAALYQNGENAATAKDYELAYTSYSDSTVAFTTVYQEVTLKRNAADLAIEAARNKQAATSALAQEADQIAPLPEGTPGFEEEPLPDADAAQEEEVQ